MKKLLEMLRSARDKKGYSQEYLAEIMRVSSSRVSRWETGKTEMTFRQSQMYAAHVGSRSTKLFEFLAHSGQAEASPIAEIHIDVFTEEAFKKLTEVVCKLGINHATMTTKRLLTWK